MITYKSKDKNSKTWYVLSLVSYYNGLMFDAYYYNIGDIIYSEPSKAAEEAFEREMMWEKLRKTKPSNLEILKNFDVVATEIKEYNKRKKNNGSISQPQECVEINNDEEYRKKEWKMLAGKMSKKF